MFMRERSGLESVKMYTIHQSRSWQEIVGVFKLSNREGKYLQGCGKHLGNTSRTGRVLQRCEHPWCKRQVEGALISSEERGCAEGVP